MVDKVTVTNVLLINNCICNHYKKKMRGSQTKQTKTYKRMNEQTNK